MDVCEEGSGEIFMKALFLAFIPVIALEIGMVIGSSIVLLIEWLKEKYL